MRNSSKILKRAIVAANQTLQSLFDLDAHVAKASELIEESLRAGNKLLVCGNGGSAADASHFATEFMVRFTKDRPAYTFPLGRPPLSVLPSAIFVDKQGFFAEGRISVKVMTT